MKLRWFIRSVAGIAVFLMLWQFFTRSYGIADIYFYSALLCFSLGLELVHAELQI